MGKNKWVMVLAVLAGVFFSGCGQTIPLSDRAIVKAVFAEKKEEGCRVGMVIAEETDEESDGGAQEKILLKWGEGDTVAQAVYEIESASRRTMFYSQNQLLLLGKNATQEGFLETSSYFATEQASRPNMAVYATELTCEDFEKWSDRDSFFQDINTLEKGLEKSPKTGRMIYELNTTQDEFEGLVPFLQLKKQGTEASQMILYENSRPQRLLKGDDAQMARLLLGMQAKLKFSQENGEQTIQYALDDAHIIREVVETPQGPVLYLELCGVVRGVTTGGAKEQAESTLWKNRSKLSEVISQEIAQKLQQTLDMTWSPDSDPFRLQWWFRLWNKEKANRLMEQGQLWEYPSVIAKATVKVI